MENTCHKRQARSGAASGSYRRAVQSPSSCNTGAAFKNLVPRLSGETALAEGLFFLSFIWLGPVRGPAMPFAIQRRWGGR